jgi:hypothetical protein
MPDLNDLADGVRATANAATWPDAAEIRSRGDGAARRRLAGLATAVTVLLIGALTWWGLPRIDDHTPAGPSATGPSAAGPSATGSAVPHERISVLVQTSLTHDAEALSVASGHGSLWLAFRAGPVASADIPPGPGELVRLDASTLAVTARWPIVGSPIALVVTDRYVWVAGDVFDARPPASNANRVQQFDLTGTLLHTYTVDSPHAMVAAGGDAVWAQYGPSSAMRLARLHDGVADAPLPLDGDFALDPAHGRPLLTCPDAVYSAVGDSVGQTTWVTRVVAGAAAGTVRLRQLSIPTLLCRPGGGVLVVAPNPPSGTTGYEVFAGPAAPRLIGSLPPYARALGASGDQVWAAVGTRPGSTRIWLADDGSLADASSPITLPLDVVLVATGDRTLWTVSSDPARPGATAIVALTVTGP